MNVNMIVSATAVLVGLMVGLVFYLQSQSDDASYLVKSKWSVTTADGTAQTWLIDSESGAISIRSVRGSTAHVQEFFGGKEYTYTTDHEQPATKSIEDETTEFCAPITHGDGNGDVDCAVYYKELQGTIEGMNEVLTGTKHLCTTQDSEKLSATTIKSDGNLSVGGFIVSMVNGSPSAILDRAGNSIATINSFEDFEEVKLTGCDTSEEATYLDAIANVADSRRKLGEVDAEVMKARTLVDDILLGYMSDDIKEEAARHLYLDETYGMGNGSTSTGGGDNDDCKKNYIPKGVRDTVQKNTFGLQSEPYYTNIYGNKKTDFGSLASFAGAIQANKAVTGKFKSWKGTPLCQGEGNKKTHRSSATNWCGSFSNREHTPCPAYGTWYNNMHKNNGHRRNPGNGVTTDTGKHDWKTDGACRRHDHGIRFDYISGGVRLGCMIDSDLNQASRHNRAVQSVFGETGAARINSWGCYTTGLRYRWAIVNGQWTYKSFIEEYIEVGLWRYNSANLNNHHAGYYVPFRYCHSDKTYGFTPNTYATRWNGKDIKSPWWENDYDKNLFPLYPLQQGMFWNSAKGYWDGLTSDGDDDGTGLTGVRPGRV